MPHHASSDHGWLRRWWRAGDRAAEQRRVIDELHMILDHHLARDDARRPR